MGLEEGPEEFKPPPLPLSSSQDKEFFFWFFAYFSFSETKSSESSISRRLEAEPWKSSTSKGLEAELSVYSTGIIFKGLFPSLTLPNLRVEKLPSASVKPVTKYH